MKLQVGDLTGAEDDFERCTSLAPAFADGWAQWSDVLRRIGDNAGAARVLAAGLRSCPESPGLHLMRARQWRLEGRNEDAIRDYVTSAQLRPGEPEAYVELGTTLIDLGRVDEGIEQLQHALQAEPSNPLALGTLAFHAILSGDEASARRWLTQVNRQPRMPAGAIAQLRGAFREKFGHD